ncbi:bifunctional 3-demethylubiquinone-9 3-methyltransferase/ 2-octaprenyl-6-hydroxy phenol methylase [compost metagenome]
MKLDENTLKGLHSDEYVANYEKKPIDRLMRLDKYINLSDNDVVVDFACGNAMMLEVLGRRINEYHGVDFSSDMLKAARIRADRLGFHGARFYEEDIIGFSERHLNAFDAGFAMDFSEHVYDEEWVALLKAMRKTLKSGARLYMHTPNACYFIEIMKQKGMLKQFPQHIAVRDVEYNKRLIFEAGFKAVNVKLLSHYELRQKPFQLISMIPGIGKYFKARIFMIAIA